MGVHTDLEVTLDDGRNGSGQLLRSSENEETLL